MLRKLKIAKISTDYCEYLRKYDNKVSYNKGKKELRPFVGILFTINNCEYFAPLSSPKEKHLKMNNTIDFLKIDNGKLGAVNFNNMIPVHSNNYKIIKLYDKDNLILDKKYQHLLLEQYTWLNENYIQIKNKSCFLYKSYINKKLSEHIKSRCCDFPLLEAKSKEYNK
ncbi:MAG: type III toxin-antitoxin system ToxN/AbiQ family toxin [Bacilli bacterium]